MSQEESRKEKLSDYCVIDHFAKAEGFEDPAPMSFRKVIGLPFLYIDRKMHFTGIRGRVWRMMGIDRSTKNPNICNQ